MLNLIESIKPSLLISFIWCSPFFYMILLFRTYLSPLQLLLCCVAAVKRLPVHHYSAYYIFWSFGIIEFIYNNFEKNRVLLNPMLGGVADDAYFSTGQELNKTESATFINLEYSFRLKTLTI